MTVIFVVHAERSQTLENKHLERRPPTFHGGLEHIFAAIWAVP
jgi:hypothetical protein